MTLEMRRFPNSCIQAPGKAPWICCMNLTLSDSPVPSQPRGAQGFVSLTARFWL